MGLGFTRCGGRGAVVGKCAGKSPGGPAGLEEAPVRCAGHIKFRLKRGGVTP